MMPKTAVRSCTRDDLAAVQEIYALEVRDGTASFELEPPSLAEMTARCAAIEAAGLPTLHVAGETTIGAPGAGNTLVLVKLRVEPGQVKAGTHPIEFKVRALGVEGVSVAEKSVFIVR